MNKRIIRERIYIKYFSGIRNGIPFSELPKDILPTDIIDIEKEESFYSENESWDNHTNLIVYREREETDEEFEKRKLKLEKLAEESKKKRYETYLSLKKEFE